MKVFDVPQAYSDLADELTLVLMSGETPSDDLLSRLEAFKHDGPEAINGWCSTILEVSAAQDAIKKERTRLDKKQKNLEACEEYMRLALANVLDTAFNGKFKSPIRSAYTTDKEEIEVEVLDPEALPPAFQRVKVEPKLSDLKEVAKAGETVPGATFTKVIKHRLTIR